MKFMEMVVMTFSTTILDLGMMVSKSTLLKELQAMWQSFLVLKKCAGRSC